MAVQAASPLAFITGGNGGGPSNPTLSPEAYERRQQLAMALMKEGGNYAPIQSPWQGVARVADAISGAVQSGWADQDNKAAEAASEARFADLYGGFGAGGASPASPAPGTSSAAPADGSTPAPVADAGTSGQTGGEYVAGVGGSRSWRNNNPGNIEYGGVAKSMGAVGSDGRFAIFPDYDTGRKAQEHLLFDSGSYKNLTLAQAINRWAPGTENNVPAYIAAMGADPNTRMSAFSPQQRATLMNNMQLHEGWHPGKPGNNATAQAAPVPVQPAANPEAVASANPNFVPQQGTPSQASPPLPPIDPRTADAQMPQQALGQPQLASAIPSAPPPMQTPSAPTLPLVNGSTGALAQAPQMQGATPAPAPIPPPQQFAPGSLTSDQAGAAADAGQRVPMSAVAMPPDPTAPQSAPLNQSASNGPVGLPQPVPVAPPPPVAAIIAQNAAKGAPAVAQALGPSAAAPAPQQPSTPGSQQVAQALMPQTPQMDPRKLAAVMADPRIPDSAKSMLLRRMQPPEYSYQTLPDGTILRMDPRGGAPVPVYQAPVKPVPKHFETVNGRVIASDETTGASSDVTPANLPPGARPLTDAEKQQFGIPPNMAVAMGADGKPFAIGGNQNNVNVNTAEETAENKKRGEINATNLATAQQEGFTAKDDLGTINDLRATVSSIPTGFTTAVQAAASNYGIKLGPNASAIEYASSLIDKLTPQQRNGMPGAASDRDVAMFKNALPKMMNTPDGNAIILDTMQGMAEQKVARGKIANDYMTGQIDAKTAYQRMGDLPSPLLGFQQYLKAHPQGGAPQAPAAPQPVAPAQQGTSAPTGAAPPAGHPTARQAPNGKWYEPNPAYKTDPTTNQWFEVVP